MTVDLVASSLSSEMNIWYLDDATLDGPADSDIEDVRICVTQLKKIDFEINPLSVYMIYMIYPVDEFTELETK